MKELLNELGFTKAVAILSEKEEFNRKLSIAYASYMFVKPEIFNKFDENLQTKTLKDRDSYRTYDKLAFTPIADYDTIPPESVLQEIKKAKDLNCFDSFEICKIESVKEVKDPIVFGVINGCTDKFYISHWDNDISIEEILEGKKKGE